MKLTKYILIGCLVTGAAVLAQGPPGGGRGPGGFGPGGPGGFGMHGGKVVAGAAYSADVNFTRTETLSDGNTIQSTTTGKVARDAVGRTYSMETMTGGPFGQTGPTTRISIFDPVAGYVYELNTTTKTAVRRAVHSSPAGASPQGMHKGPGPEANSATMPHPDFVKTDLGTQVVNNVSAQGTQRTRTIPAGAMGNSNPITSTTEVWYSPDLQTVISSKMSDPRMGLSVFALTNIQRTAPEASLFQVPAGYTVSDAKHEGAGRGRFGPPGPAPQE
jgi:hypothetical protein